MTDATTGNCSVFPWRGTVGREAISVEELYQHFLSLEKLGCHNINLVTGEHYLPGILEAIRLAKKRGFSLPFVWNCSGYQSREVLASCEGLIDIYLFDFKLNNILVLLQNDLKVLLKGSDL